MKMNTLLIEKNDSDSDSINKIENLGNSIGMIRRETEIDTARKFNVKLFENNGVRYFKIRIGNDDIKAMVDSGANVSSTKMR
ncbi:hypothetical protein SNEBB_007897 [Seison nebaliae]|nr:hypothetical protein SNEBB_007897 [Seison nebaliae]